ncbi:MAG: hypothetical protein ABIL05_04915 [candidate division WOR-3 bacterium]
MFANIDGFVKFEFIPHATDRRRISVYPERTW